jgi:hypothetical protein
MGSLTRRADRLAKAGGLERTVLLCPECGEEFVVFGDAPLEFIAYDYCRVTGEKNYRETPEDMLRAFEHEHDPGGFLKKRSGLPFLSKAAGGFDFGGGRGA